MKKAKKIEKKFIEITPHRSILTKISQTGYSIQEALSELIDNAIDARLPNKKLIVKINITPQKIEVIDNGRGMSEIESARAIRLGFSSKKNKLGEFGLGLKTATSFLGKVFELNTTQINSNKRYIIKYSEDDWLKNGDWNEYPFYIENGVNKKTSGMMVVIKKLKVKFSDKLLQNINTEFGARFGPFINNNELNIVFNKIRCKSYESTLLEDKKNKINIKFKGGKAVGWWGYQLVGLNKSYYGFSTFRRGRLVTTYDKTGLTPNQDIRQIIGELHIEGIPITHDKKGWLQSSIEYQALEKAMRIYFKKFERKPRRVLAGYSASGGKVSGVVRIIDMNMSGSLSKELAKIKRGDILVTKMTRPPFLLGIKRSKGIITDLGGSLCHAAIMSREFNIPAVVGTQNATIVLKDGQKVILDGDNGNIYTYED